MCAWLTRYIGQLIVPKYIYYLSVLCQSRQQRLTHCAYQYTGIQQIPLPYTNINTNHHVLYFSTLHILSWQEDEQPTVVYDAMHRAHNIYQVESDHQTLLP